MIKSTTLIKVVTMEELLDLYFSPSEVRNYLELSPLESVKTILEQHSNYSYHYCLDWALRNRSMEVVNYLIDRFELSEPDVYTIFKRAIQRESLEFILSLIERFRWSRREIRNHCALQHASDYGRLDLIKYLVEQFQLTREDATEGYNYALRYASMNGHLEVVIYLVEQFKLTAEDVGAFNNFALCSASKNQHLKIVEYITERFKIDREPLRES